jgi:hypothetical protein
MSRRPAVAGLFYPDQADPLKKAVLNYIGSSPDPISALKAMIVPHAGYIYSGQIAGYGYNLLKSNARKVQRVVILGPTHRVPFFGLAVPSHSKFTTPLGDVTVDQTAVQSLVDNGFAKYFNEAHQLEHSIEVHLPFLQLVLDDFSIVPIVVGQTNSEHVSTTIEELWGGEETLIIVSSDLSHYHPYLEAQSLDNKTALAIENFDIDAIDHEQACGATPIQGLLRSAAKHKLKITRLALCNSGDTAGNKDSVVGYATFVFAEK